MVNDRLLTGMILQAGHMRLVAQNSRVPYGTIFSVEIMHHDWGECSNPNSKGQLGETKQETKPKPLVCLVHKRENEKSYPV